VRLDIIISSVYLSYVVGKQIRDLLFHLFIPWISCFNFLVEKLTAYMGPQL